MQLTIAILAAMRAELEPFLALGLGHEQAAQLFNRPVYLSQASFHRPGVGILPVTLVLTVSGVGKVRSALTAQAVIDRYHPNLLLNIGTAGGLRPEVRVGDIVVTTGQYQHDNQLWERYAAQADSGLSELLHRQLSRDQRVHVGNGCAGDVFQNDVTGKRALAERFAAYCVDMESAAVADACALNQVPFCAIRSISDTLEGDADQFEQNYRQVSQAVAQAVAPLVGELAWELAARLGQPPSFEASDGRFATLTTDRLLLRRLRSDDAERLSRYRSDPQVARFQSWESYSLAQAESLVSQQAGFDAGYAGTWFQLGVADRKTGHLLGDIGLHTLAHDPRQVELGFTLARECQGQGLASEALTALIDWLFTTQGIHRIACYTDDENTACIRLLTRLGFRQEGLLRQSTWSGDEWRDDRLFALLLEDWGSAVGPSDC